MLTAANDHIYHNKTWKKNLITLKNKQNNNATTKEDFKVIRAQG